MTPKLNPVGAKTELRYSIARLGKTSIELEKHVNTKDLLNHRPSQNDKPCPNFQSGPTSDKEYTKNVSTPVTTFGKPLGNTMA